MHRYQDRDSQKRNVWARTIFHIRFRPLDRGDAVSWVEMDFRHKEWSTEVSVKDQYCIHAPSPYLGPAINVGL